MDMQTRRDGRARADDATDALRQALEALGVPERVRDHVRPVVLHTGTPYVHVGMVRADHIEQIAEALRIAAAVRSPAS